MAGRIEDYAIVGDMRTTARLSSTRLFALRNDVALLSEEYERRGVPG